MALNKKTEIDQPVGSESFDSLDAANKAARKLRRQGLAVAIVRCESAKTEKDRFGYEQHTAVVGEWLTDFAGPLLTAAEIKRAKIQHDPFSREYERTGI